MNDPGDSVVKIQQQTQRLADCIKRCGQEDCKEALVAMGTISHYIEEIQQWIIQQRLK